MFLNSEHWLSIWKWVSKAAAEGQLKKMLCTKENVRKQRIIILMENKENHITLMSTTYFSLSHRFH